MSAARPEPGGPCPKCDGARHQPGQPPPSRSHLVLDGRHASSRFIPMNNTMTLSDARAAHHTARVSLGSAVRALDAQQVKCMTDHSREAITMRDGLLTVAKRREVEARRLEDLCEELGG